MERQFRMVLCIDEQSIEVEDNSVQTHTVGSGYWLIAYSMQ